MSMCLYLLYSKTPEGEEEQYTMHNFVKSRISYIRILGLERHINEYMYYSTFSFFRVLSYLQLS